MPGNEEVDVEALGMLQMLQPHRLEMLHPVNAQLTFDGVHTSENVTTVVAAVVHVQCPADVVCITRSGSITSPKTTQLNISFPG